MGLKKGEAEKLLINEQSPDYGTLVEITEKKSKKKQKEETTNVFHLFKYTTRWDRTLLITGIVFSFISGSCLPILGLFFGGMTNVFLNQATQGLVSDEVVNATLLNATSQAHPVAIRYDQRLVPLSLLEDNHTITFKVVYVINEIFQAELPQNDLWGSNAYGNGSIPMTTREFENTLNKYLIIYLIIGTIMMICSFVQSVGNMLVNTKFIRCVKFTFHKLCVRISRGMIPTIMETCPINYQNETLLLQMCDMAYVSRIDLERIRDGTGYKAIMIIQYVVTFFSGIAVGLYVNVPLTLVTLCVGPFVIGLTAYSARFSATTGAREQEKYGAAGAVAEETLSNIKTVQAFCGFSLSIRKYGEHLEAGRKIAMSKYNIFSVCISIMFALMYAAYGLGFWYGSQLVQSRAATPGSVFTVFFSVVVGAFSVGNALPYFNIVSTAVGVMSGIKKIISRQPTIDAYSNEGRTLHKVNGEIEFKNVSFSYPSRPNVQVLKDLNLKIESGKTVAIVGSSGGGKSTIVGLLLRFYEIQKGSITVDNNPVDELNVNWWRKQIGLVSQEPVLFGVSIFDNIRYGTEKVSFWEVIEAAKNANAHDFITKLPEGYDTLVGDTGSQLSGGQKQRIAIARALVRNPKILLLDEATSALDAQSEGIVQEALEKAMRGRSTVIIAHRLSTIRNADIIYVMQGGAVFESGKHDDLMKNESLYHSLVMAQMKSDEKDSDSPTSADETNDESSSRGESDVLNNQNDTRGSQLRPAELLQELKDADENYKIDFSTKGEDGKNLNGEELDDEESKWKVLDRDVTEETIPNDNEDDEYETVVTHVRETREILYSDDEEEANQPQPGTSGEVENNFKEPASSSRKKHSSVPEEEIELIPLRQPEEIEKDISFWEIAKLHEQEWKWLLMGYMGCTFSGLVMPIFALYYGQIFTVFTKTGIELIEDTKFWTCMFILLSVFMAVSSYCQFKGNTTANEKVIVKLRYLVFENILRQPVGWFDLETSQPGILVNRLARSAPLIKAAAGLRAAQVIQSTVVLIGAFVIAFICGWKLALILAICVPIIIYASYKQQVLLKQFQARDSQLMDEAGRITSEVVRNIRTVQALGQEKLFLEIYSENLELPYREAKVQALIYSLLYSATQALTYYMYAIAFRVGGYLVEIGDMKTDNIYKVFFALSLCAQSIGNAFSYLQDYSKARTAMRLLNYLLTRKSEIDSTSPLGIKPDIKGRIYFKKVHFSYPNRPSAKVLRGLNLVVEAGKTLALVGESGCGKSTVISLLERFYDPTAGNIKIDGYDIRTLNLAHLRSKIGLVTQEPILFDISIKDNIAYGAISLQENVSFDDVIRAAKLANVHDFVMKLPAKYDTLVGERGIQLSGGQKQRVAIARALIRDPKILLLDEATSALDTESEKIVQEALDVAKIGRTCIIVAHRLSTIQNADIICVMQKGKIVEKGTHAELLAMQGHYYQLTQRQVL